MDSPAVITKNKPCKAGRDDQGETGHKPIAMAALDVKTAAESAGRSSAPAETEESRLRIGESRGGRSALQASNLVRWDSYFLGYQAKWIWDTSNLIIVEKGRQEGFSYCHSYKVVRRASIKGAIDEWVVSRDEVQSKQFILYCKRWARVLNFAAEDLGEQVLLSEGGKAVQVQVLKFASGACIYALSSNPDAIVGKTGNVTLDEFALHKDQRQLYAVAKPVTQWGGSLEIISTHRGVKTVFNEIILDIKQNGNRMGWSLHSVPIQKAVEDGLVEKIDAATKGKLTEQYLAAEKVGGPGIPVPSLREWWLAKQRAECIDEEQWLQEYCCVPADEATAFISYEMITQAEEANCLKDFQYLVDGPAGRPPTLYVGVDVARKKDLCVIDVGELVGDVMWDRLRIELQGKKFSEIEYELYRVLNLPGVKRCCIDATGMGMQLAERATERFGYRVEGVTFTAPVKEELAFGLRGAFEDHRLRIPRDDRLKADLRGIKKEVTAAGNIRFVGESEDSHCDRFWAKALRQHAAGAKQCGSFIGPSGIRAGVLAARGKREVLA